MALEDAIKELNETMKALITVMSTASNPFPQPGDKASPLPAGTETKNRGGRPTKAEQEAKAALQKNELGDPVGTKYYWNDTHKTGFSVKPGETHPGVEGAEVTAAQFTANCAQPKDTGVKVQLADDPFAEPAAGEDPFAEPAKRRTLEETVEQLKKLNGTEGKGRDAVMAVLKQFGTDKVGSIPTDKLNEVYAATEKALQS